MSRLKIGFKDLLLIAVGLVFAFIILFISLEKTLSSLTFSFLPKSSFFESKRSFSQQEVLPGDFFYSLKMVRDRISLLLTFDPLKKTEKLLSFADRRLETGKILIEKKEEELGIATLLKAEKYLERAMVQEEMARKKQKDTKPVLEKILKGAEKHETILLKIEENIDITKKGEIEKLLYYPRYIYQEARKRISG